MLPSITKRYIDLSTGKHFQFAFLCDGCGAQWISEKYPFSMANNQPQNDGESSAYAVLYKAEHDAAYERANIEGLFHFNKCKSCGRRVCDHCFAELDDVCIRCT